ncbi:MULTISPECIES: hypothetical protein [unclassified Streptomyces]|uniref:hypothetical protein n=1 Tax=unclassified Streptomyces TaxID=2593676 RepID=UPI000805570C|nr:MULTISPECIES: hypothetical protein [unclassified Streptomyces]MYR70941.1 hypothetical protein [Streptomyces sp. SID4925]SBU93193.1 hypothetical protein YUMDRAFT_04611 [Streptomyces sp. OspMP-M45]
MSFEEEWNQLREAAAARWNGMRINSGPAEVEGGGAADLVVHRDSLGAIGNDAYDLRERLSRQGDHARPATFEAATALTNGNFASGSAVLKVHDNWKAHLKTLLDSLAHISNHLDYTKAQHAKDEIRIEGDLAPISKLREYMK